MSQMIFPSTREDGGIDLHLGDDHRRIGDILPNNLGRFVGIIRVNGYRAGLIGNSLQEVFDELQKWVQDGMPADSHLTKWGRKKELELLILEY